jgi:RimJ/RimL family protein N-acetyltransferase
MSTGEVSLRVLVPGDEPALGAFLRAREESSMLMLGNLARGGIVDRGERFNGTYVGRFRDGALEGVVAHCWNGNVLVQAADASADHVLRAAQRSGRSVKGLIGPWEQVAPLRAIRPFSEWPVQLDAHEILYALQLERLRVPPLLASGRARVRRAKPAELDTLVEWGLEYGEEALNEPRSEEAAASERASTARHIADGDVYVLELDGAPVAQSAGTASTETTVQIGGVWTPRELRRRGYARAVVAGQLEIARSEGKNRSVLFTQKTNIAAQRAYEAIGYVRIGEYGLIHFAGAGGTVAGA